MAVLEQRWGDFQRYGFSWDTNHERPESGLFAMRKSIQTRLGQKSISKPRRSRYLRSLPTTPMAGSSQQPSHRECLRLGSQSDFHVVQEPALPIFLDNVFKTSTSNRLRFIFLLSSAQPFQPSVLSFPIE